MKEKISPLKKVVLSIEAGSSPDSMDLTREPFQFGFIFGIGHDGLTPFEYALADKVNGDKVVLWVDRGRLAETFGHLGVPLPKMTDDFERIFLGVRVEEIATADQKEVIRALADLCSCGSHCCGH